MKIKTAYKTAVVILSYNGVALHKLFLPKIVEESKENYTVVVVDHCSTDNTSEYISQNFPTVELIRLDENRGFAWGYAQALKQIEATYYILLSADFEVTTGWYAPLLNAMEVHPTMAACQPKIRFYKEREKFEYAGAAGGFMDKWGYSFCRGRIFDTLEVDEGQYDNDIEVFWASGGCFMVRSKVYHELGGLDADFFAHMEEIDLCWRIHNAGHRIGYIHNSTVFHVGGSVISYGSPQKTYYNFRNSFWLFLKNEQSSKLLWLIPLRLLLDGVAGVRFLSGGQVKNCWAIVRAHFAFYRSIPSLLRKRSRNKKLIRVVNKSGIYKGNILLDYFFKNRKTFKELPFKPTPL